MDENQKYSRQINLKGFGPLSQERLKASKVLLVGLGGLGSPTAIYLTRAGVGNLGLVEFDRIDSSNLPRQILFDEDDIGKGKIEVAKEKLLKINSKIKIKIFNKKLSQDNIVSIFKNYNLIIDASDNFETRYLINDTCVKMNLPFIHGSVSGFEGFVSIFNSKKDSPCYRCLYPEISNDGKGCSEFGVLSTAAGIVGVLMAHESIKFLTRANNTLDKKLLFLKDSGLESFNLSKDPDCPMCGKGIVISKKEFPNELNFKDFLKIKDRATLIDIREPFEYKNKNLGGINLPFNSITPEKIEHLKNQEIVILCYSGERSKKVQEMLRQNNFDKTYNLKGGIREAFLNSPAEFLEDTL